MLNEGCGPQSPTWRCLGETQEVFIEVTWGPAHPTKPERQTEDRDRDRKTEKGSVFCVLLRKSVF